MALPAPVPAAVTASVPCSVEADIDPAVELFQAAASPSCMHGLSRLGGRFHPHPPTGDTSLLHGCEAELAHANGLDLAGITRCRSWGCGVQVTYMGVRLQVVPCGSNAVPCLRKSLMEEGIAHVMQP